MSHRFAPLIALMLLCVAGRTHAQGTTCEAPTALIERVYVDVVNVSFPDLLVDVGPGPLPMTQDQSRRYRWFLDLWGAAIVKPVALGTLAEKMKRPGAVTNQNKAWVFDATADPLQPSHEMVGGQLRCTAIFSYRAVPLLRVRVEARPKGFKPVLILCPDLPCALNAATNPGERPANRAHTDFETEPLRQREQFQLTASFTDDCTVSLVVTVRDPADKEFPRRTLYDNLSESCLAFYSMLPKVIARQFLSAFLTMPESIIVRRISKP